MVGNHPGDDDIDGIIAMGSWGNGGFAIEFPQTLDAKYLKFIEDENEFSMDGVTYSNNNAKLRFAWIAGYDKDDKFIDYFYYGKMDENENSYTGGGYIYVDIDVNISGTVKVTESFWEENYVYEPNLKKGWNIMYFSESFVREDGKEVATKEWKTATVNGLKWYASEDFWDLFDMIDPEIEAERYGVLAGIVFDTETQIPLKNVLVSISPIGKEVFTDETGHIWIEDLELGEYTVTLTKDDYETKTEIVFIEDGKNSFTFELEPILPQEDGDDGDGTTN